MVVANSPNISHQSRSTLTLDLSPNSFTRILELYLSILNGEEKSPATIETYRQRLGPFLTSISDYHLSLDQITSTEIRFYLLTLKERRCVASTVDANFRALRSFFNRLVSEQLLSESPMASMKAPKIPKVIPRTFTLDDIHRMLALCPQSTYLGIRNRAIILLFMDTGIRLIEMAGIQLSDIDKNYELIKIFGKGAKERIVPMGVGTQKAFLKYKTLFRNDAKPCLWLTEEGRPMTRNGIQMMIERIIKRAGITGVKVGPHAFRHFAATNYLKNGGDKSTLKTLLGHSTYTMVDRYCGSVETEMMQRTHRNASPVDRMRL